MAVNVLLARDVPEERRYSMERYADELQRAFNDNPTYSVGSMVIHQAAFAARLGLPRLDSYFARFVRYPIAAALREADVYHIIDQGYAHIAAFLPKRRTVITCHDLMLLRARDGTLGPKGTWTSTLRFQWSTSYLQRVGHVICVSEATRADLQRYRRVPEDRVSVVPNGIASRFRPLNEEAIRAAKTTLLGNADQAILHVSTGVPYKNVDATLRVLGALRSAGRNVALVRVGVSLNDAEVDLARKLGVIEYVVECGRVGDDRLVELYNASEVLLFPSFHEGFGWPPLEAMACGTPVVTSDAPALMEIVEGAGLVAPPGDLRGLTAAIRAILDDPGFASKLRAQGLARASYYTWGRTTAGVADVYAKVLEESARRATIKVRP